MGGTVVSVLLENRLNDPVCHRVKDRRLVLLSNGHLCRAELGKRPESNEFRNSYLSKNLLHEEIVCYL